LSLKSYSFSGTASDAGIKNVLDLTQATGASHPLKPADVVDLGPLREAQAALGIR
jgi:hypothetical protein